MSSKRNKKQLERKFEGFYFGRKHERRRPDYVFGCSVQEQETDQAVSCWRKVFYGTEAKALQAIQKNKAVGILEAYPCAYCRGWHIGHVRKKKKGKK